MPSRLGRIESWVRFPPVPFCGCQAMQANNDATRRESDALACTDRRVFASGTSEYEAGVIPANPTIRNWTATNLQLKRRAKKLLMVLLIRQNSRPCNPSVYRDLEHLRHSLRSITRRGNRQLGIRSCPSSLCTTLSMTQAHFQAQSHPWLLRSVRLTFFG
ncbi:hypothetical protein BO94DRAFT_155128 [Aspergillus sclerotioniger CBS 115572]|uniref:Uncharacterized protein n=1 Tax=Aspergillus sclerotioniger CBS 115572 TaxID=1450535 RepID=A0A317W0W5_9EURO|nr:hypothetical protein BO94DRAFT_155128 [Aspergillus sclerotioniger CBS 115572]PWY80286.1 hypothetical protein BO94DRAFT_155128 [Aspergillus sclerotioniger CBS 115572]